MEVRTQVVQSADVRGRLQRNCQKYAEALDAREALDLLLRTSKCSNIETWALNDGGLKWLKRTVRCPKVECTGQRHSCATHPSVLRAVVKVSKQSARQQCRLPVRPAAAGCAAWLHACMHTQAPAAASGSQ